jgi:hypothetical protein
MMAATATAVVVVVARLVGEVGGEVGGVVSGKVSGVVGGCVLCLTPTYRRNRTDMYWNENRYAMTFGGLSRWQQ